MSELLLDAALRSCESREEEHLVLAQGFDRAGYRSASVICELLSHLRRDGEVGMRLERLGDGVVIFRFVEPGVSA